MDMRTHEYFLSGLFLFSLFAFTLNYFSLGKIRKNQTLTYIVTATVSLWLLNLRILKVSDFFLRTQSTKHVDSTDEFLIRPLQ